MSWKPEVEEIRRRESLAADMGGAERVERQHTAGRLTVRERIESLLDPESFHETGALAGVPTYDGDRLTALRPSNFVMGTGYLAGARIVIAGDDFTVRGGAADGAVGMKASYACRWCVWSTEPVVAEA